MAQKKKHCSTYALERAATAIDKEVLVKGK
jgi:hypothetical protein